MASNSIAVQRVDRYKQIIQSDNFRAEVSQALPVHIRPERFQRVLLTSVINDKRLLDVEPIKVVKAALKVAPLGLLTDPLLGEAALVVDGKQDVQVRVMYRGLLKLAKQSGEVSAVYAHDICRNDKVKVSLGTDKKLEHEPAEGDRGEPTRYYAVVKYRSGDIDFEIMTVPEIHRIRDRSDAWRAYKAQKIKSTPWATDEPEMCKKTVLRRLMKRVPTSPDLADALRLEDEADAKEYGARPVHAPAPQIYDEPEYIELVDQYGETYMVSPGEVSAKLAEWAGECTDEQLGYLLENNEAQVAVDAVEAERAKRAKQAASEGNMREIVSIVPAAGKTPIYTGSLLSEAGKAYGEVKAKAADKTAVAVANLQALKVMVQYAKGEGKTKLEQEIAAVEAVGEAA